MKYVSLLRDCSISLFVVQRILSKKKIRSEFKEEFACMTDGLKVLRKKMKFKIGFLRRCFIKIQFWSVVPILYILSFLHITKQLKIFSFFTKRLYESFYNGVNDDNFGLYAMYRFAFKASRWSENFFYPKPKSIVRFRRKVPYLNPKPIWHKGSR